MSRGIATVNLTAGYGTPIVSDISFEVKKGQILALIGPNGAGKSTVLKTITRQLHKINGKIYIQEKDEDLLKGEELARKLSMVTTEHIHPELMSCREIVATGRYPYTGRLGILDDNDLKKVDEALNLVGGQDVAGQEFSKVSDGQRQRVMLARAICQEPEVMILDEPTSFLDIQFKVDILTVIKRLVIDKNIAVIMSIHDLEFVPAISDSVIAIDAGGVVAYGTPEDIITGEMIEKLYHMKSGHGDTLVEGLIGYAEKLKDIINC